MILVAIANDTPENLQPLTKFGGVVISDYPTLDIIKAYKSNRIKPGIWDRKWNKANTTLPITLLIDSSGKIVRKFTGNSIGRARSEDLLQAVLRYL